MKARALLAVVALALLAGCDRLPGKPTAAERWVDPSEVVDPVTLFADSCSGCHGQAGRPGPARQLEDPLYLAVIGRDEFRRVVSEGVPGTLMPAFAKDVGGWLTAGQIDALVEGIFGPAPRPSLPAGAVLPSYAVPASAGDAARGEAVYVRYCAECHGPDGRGGEHAGSVVDPAYLGLVSDQALRSAVIAGRIDLDMPGFAGYRDLPPMSDQDVSDVTAWLASHRRAFPGSPYPLPPEATAAAAEP